LDESIEDKTLLIDCAPEPMLLAGDDYDDFVQVPFVATAWGFPMDAVSEFAAEF
jgi:hypothetical protein